MNEPVPGWDVTWILTGTVAITAMLWLACTWLIEHRLLPALRGPVQRLRQAVRGMAADDDWHPLDEDVPRPMAPAQRGEMPEAGTVSDHGPGHPDATRFGAPDEPFWQDGTDPPGPDVLPTPAGRDMGDVDATSSATGPGAMFRAFARALRPPQQGEDWQRESAHALDDRGPGSAVNGAPDLDTLDALIEAQRHNTIADPELFEWVQKALGYASTECWEDAAWAAVRRQAVAT